MGLKEEDLADGETVVLSLRTHLKALFWPIVLVIALVAINIVTWLVLPTPRIVAWIVLSLAVVAAFIWFGIPHLKWMTTEYVVTNKRVCVRSGIFTKRGRDIPLYRINDVSSEKSLLDRMFDCGTLLISDASENPPLVLNDVPHVDRVRKRLHELLFAHDDNSDEGEWPPTEPHRQRAQA